MSAARCLAIAALFSSSVGAAVSHGQATRDRVIALRERGAYEEAVAAARRADLLNLAGEILVLRGRTSEADQAFRAAISGGRPDSLVARLNLALLREARGEGAAARRDFQTFIDVYNGGRRLTAVELAAVGTAVDHLSRYDPQLARDALRAYDEAIAADPTNVDARLAVADLFLRRYNGTEARAAFDQVLAIDSAQPRALLGLARTARFEGSRESIELARRALEHNPNLVPARVFLAELYVELDQFDRAAREIARALEVNPSAVGALAVRASIAYLQGDPAEFARITAQVRARNPTGAGFYETVANAAARNRRYREAANLAREAVALDSASWRAWALLGTNQLRVGAMDAGRANLERAFRGDPFDVWTKNTLDLLDTLSRYATTASPRFRFVVDGKESELLTLYLGAIAEAAYDSLARRYGYRPATPIRVEVFPTHADFSVRTIGLVGLGALGVSFGPVIAMDSPSARPPGSFNWASTLWHEIAHTFHLGMTGSRVPRWFTEGLAVYEERRARPGWGDDLTPAFLSAYVQDRLPSVANLNDGFMRPAYPEQIAFSYYLASLVCDYVVELRGFEAILSLLDAYGGGLTSDQAFRRVFRQDLDRFGRGFDRWVRERFAAPMAAIEGDAVSPHGDVDELVAGARAAPGAFPAQLGAGLALARAGRLAEAVPYLERAKRLFPTHAGDQSAYAALARIYLAQGDPRRAAQELAALTAVNEQAYAALVQLATLRLQVGDSVGAAGALDRAMHVSPHDAAVHRRLADLAEALGRPALAVRERRAILALAPVDRAEAWYRLARAYLSAGDRGEARRSVLRALEIAPAFVEAQELLLELHGGD